MRRPSKRYGEIGTQFPDPTIPYVLFPKTDPPGNRTAYPCRYSIHTSPLKIVPRLLYEIKVQPDLT